ncbi:hypothetical protein Q1695_007026 [Nippostrongylus brasiliensis]|nr:hypothetical protein Q1695_007026 [Nippostrongylus brasiliensis]
MLVLLLEISSLLITVVRSQNTTAPIPTTVSKKIVTVGVAANEQVLPASIGWATCGGAIGEAMDRLTAEKLIDEYEFRFIVNYSECSPSAAVGVGVTFMKDVRVDMVLGPPCTEAARMMAHLSTVFKVPWVGWGYVMSADLASSTEFPYATTIMATARTLGYAVVRLLQEFNWDNLSILYTSDQINYCSDVVDDVEVALNDVRTYNPTILYKQQISMNMTDPFDEALQGLRNRSRIVLACLDTSLKRRSFLIRASQLGMTSAEYLYIFLGLRGFGFGQSATGKGMLQNGFTPFWTLNNNADGLDDVAKEAAKRVLCVDVNADGANASVLETFRKDVVSRVRRDPLYCTTPACLNNTGQNV